MYAWAGVRENPGSGGRVGGAAGGTGACAGVVGVAVLGCVAPRGASGRMGWPTVELLSVLVALWLMLPPP